MKFSIPGEWFTGGRVRLSEDGFPVRFSPAINDEICRLAALHDCSRAEIVRVLVGRSMAELQSPRRVA